jgi:hypothetical protein
VAPAPASDIAAALAPEVVPEPASSESVVDSAEQDASERPVEDEQAAVREREPDPDEDQDPGPVEEHDTSSEQEPAPAANATDGAS